MQIKHKGEAHPVTQAWHAENVEPWPELAELERPELQALANGLLQASNDRELTGEERRRLESITHHVNARNGIDWLGARPLAELGFTGVDQVHGNSATLPCGCRLHSVFDHHRRHEPDLKVHAHHGHRLCGKHQRHGKKPLADIHAAVFADNAEKG